MLQVDSHRLKHKRAACFIIGSLILLGITSFIISPREGEVYDIISTREKLQDIGQETPDSIDVLFAGDSLVFRAISPLRIWGLTGITSYDLSDGAMRLCDQSVMIKHACKEQSPRLIVVEADIFFGEASPFKDEFALPTNLIEKIFPIFHYHVFYKSFHPFEEDEDPASRRKGYKPADGVQAFDGDPDYMSEDEGGDPVVIGPMNQRYLDDINVFCGENDIELLILALPSAINYDNETHKAIQSWADDHNVKFLDMNLIPEEVGIDWSTDTKDGGDHMNPSGAEKVSSFLADYLEENYDLTDHRDDDLYEEWNIDYNELYN